MFLLSIQVTNSPRLIGPPVRPPVSGDQPATNDSTDLDSLLLGIRGEPPGPPVFPPDGEPPVPPPVTEDDHDFGRFDNPMDLLNAYVSQLARPEASLAPFILITEKQLLNALKAVTGLKPNDSRTNAVKDFAAYIIKTNKENDKWHGGYADVNGDGKTDAQDLIQAYQTGRFDLDDNDQFVPPNPRI